MVSNTEKYCPIVDRLKMTDDVLGEILFRVAGDGFLQVEYGDPEVFNLMDTFRCFAVMKAVEKRKISGLVELASAFRTVLYMYDPMIISMRELIEEVKDLEKKLGSPEELEFESRLVTLPLTFMDSVTKEAIEKYVREVRPEATKIHVIDDHNFKYVAKYNGLTPNELKQKVLGTEWMLCHQLFWPGGTYQLPIDPRCFIEAPKYNPPRTFTPEGTVGLGGSCLYIYTTPSPGGYQLLGRSIPVYQLSQKHSAYKERPFLLVASDRIKYEEVSEEQLLEIYHDVHEDPTYKYKIKIEEFHVNDLLIFQSEEIRREVEELEKRKTEAKKTIPVP